MHPTCCWQGSGRDELIGLFHPLCFKSSARLGQRTYPLLPFAAEPRWMRPLSSEDPPAHQWGPAGMSDGNGGCLPAVPPPRATIALSIVSASPGGFMSPSPTGEGKVGQDWENTPVRWESVLLPQLTTQQAGKRWELGNAVFLPKGSSAGAAGARCPRTPHPNSGTHMLPAPGLRGAAAWHPSRLGAKADGRHAPPAGSFPSKQLGALIPLCERKPAAVLTVHPRRG